MADPIDIRPIIGLPPSDTARAFGARDELRQTVKWSEMWHGDHARAFTVAKVAKLDLLNTIRASLDDALRNGGTFEQWQAGLVPELQKAGWWGRVADKELTGTSQPIFVGPRRLRTIYDTNLRVSRAAGQWARIQELKDVAPYLRYSAVMDRRTRPQHRIWHGTILRVDDPWWDEHYPPCGWRCRCNVLQLSDRDLKARGWEVSKSPPPEGPGRSFWPAGAERPVRVPSGIDPGFAYNPGKASMAAIADKAARTLAETALHNLAAARAVLRDLVDSPAFLKAMDEPDTGFPVMILDAETRGLIGADTPVAMLSSATFAKQNRNHPELTLARYRRLPEIGAAADIVARDGDTVLLMVKADDGAWLVTVVKATRTGLGLFVQSFRVQNDRSLKRLLKRAEIIRDARK